MKVNLVRTTSLNKKDLDLIYDVLFIHDGPIHFNKCNKSISFKDNEIAWAAIFSECSEYRIRNNISDEEYIILLMSERNENNWFSAPNPERNKDIFVHTDGWEHYIACNSIYAIAFQIVENLIQSLMFDQLNDGFSYFHEPAIGCINDMCSWKPDISFKLRTADICPDCLLRLQERGVGDEIIAQCIRLFEHIRKHTLFSSSIFNRDSFDETPLPFPVAITKRKLDMTIEPFRKFLLLLDHFDSIVRTTVILMGKIALKDEFDDFFKKNGLDSRPSLGDWVSALQSIAKSTNQSGIRFSDEIFNRIKSILQKAENEKIIRLRNEKRGHGYCDCNDSNYSDLYLKLHGSLECIEKSLYPILIRCNCYYVKYANRIDDNTFETRVKPLMGNHPDFIEKVVERHPEKLSDIPTINRIYMQFGENSEWYDLHPYMIYDHCPICCNNRILLKDGLSYLDPYIGHLVSI